VLTITAISAPVGGVVTYSYSYTLTAALAHTGQGEINALTDTITMTVTDATGDTDNTPGSIVISIVDDVLVAVADTGSVTEGATLTVLPANGVLSNDTAGADGFAATAIVGVKTGTDISTAASGSVGVALVGQYGTLTLGANGGYTYKANANAITANQVDHFVYTVKDGDGDLSTVTLDINVSNVTLSVAAADTDATVYEAALDTAKAGADLVGSTYTGSNPSSTGETDATNSVAGQVTGGTGPYTYALNGAAAGAYGTIQLNNDGSYVYTLSKPVDTNPDANNGANTETEAFSYTATDANGNTVTGSIVVNIVDDVPVAVADVGSVTEGATLTVLAANGVLGNDTAGADGLAANAVVGVKTGSNIATAASGSVGVAIDGTFGKLTLNADGSYTYKANANVITANQVDHFVYTVKDGDGDLSTVTLDINVSNVTLSVTGADADATVYEAALDTTKTGSDLVGSTYTGSNPSDTGETDASNTLAGQVTGGTGSYSYALNGNAAGSYGTIQLNSDGTYVYTLSKPFDTSPDANNGANTETEAFSYTATDANGNAVTGSIIVNIVDDIPLAQAGATLTVLETAGDTSWTNLLANDTKGADGATVTAVDLGMGAGFQAISSSGTTIYSNANGTYTFQANGTWSFDPAVNAQNSDTNGNFTYRITDGDGDTSTATQAVIITNANSVPTAGTAQAYVDDEALANGNAGNGQSSGDIVAGSPESVATGTLPHDYFGDGKAAVDPISFSAMNSTTGTVGTETVNYAWNAATNTLTATSTTTGRGAIFTVNVDGSNDNGNGGYTVTLLKPVLHALGNAENNADVALTYTVKDSNGDTVNGTLNVTFNDDTPIAVANTATVTAGTINEVDVVLVVDISGSMDDGVSNVPNFSDDRIGLARYSMLQMLTNNEQIDNVMIVKFSSTATGGTWMSRADAITYVNTNSNWTLGDDTNYDVALQRVIDNYGNARPGGASPETLVYFMSDGEPTVGGGIDSTATGSNVSIGEWEAFVNTPANNISGVYAVGIGANVSSTALEPISYPNTDGPDAGTVEDHVILIPNQNDLTAFVNTLQDAVGNASSVVGNVLSNDSFGADGGYIQSITINGVVYTFNGTNSVAETGSTPVGYVDHGTWIEVPTTLGGTMTFYFAATGSHVAGEWGYLAPTNAGGSESFAYTLRDGDGDTVLSSLGITVIEPNDAPAGTSSTAIILEDNALVLNATHFGFTDPNDNPANTLMNVLITEITGAGKLMNNGIQIFAGATVSAADVADGGLKFVPNADANGAAAATISFKVQDNGGTANGGVDTDQTANTLTINITAQNDAPTAVITPISYTATEQANLNLHGTGLSVGDVDAGANDITVKLSVVDGILTVAAGNSGVASISGSGTSTVTITGTVTEINNLLAGTDTGVGSGGTIVYNANVDNPPASTTLTLLVDDGGNTGGGALTATDIATITIAPINDAPNTNVVSATGLEDASSIAISLSGVDVDGTVGSYKISSLPSNGILYSNAGLTTVVTNNSTVSVSTLYFVPTANYNGSTSFQYAAVDNLGLADATPATATINVTAVNDAPTAAISLASYNATEQTDLKLHGTGLSIADIDAGSSDVKVTLSVTQGALGISAGNSGVTSVTGGGTSTVTITGTIAEINNLLGGVDTGAGSAGTLYYNADLDNPSATTTLTLLVDDLGNTGGGALTATDTAIINVTPVDDAPVATNDLVYTNLAGSSSSLVLPEWVLLFNDHDPEGNTLDVTALGTISDYSSASLATNPGSVTLVNNDSDGGSLIYTVTAGGKTDTATLTIVADTNGAIDGNNSDNIIFDGIAGAHTLNGNGGDDVLIGGSGADILTGGSGADTFVITDTTSKDTITDYVFTDGDSVDLSQLLDANFGSGSATSDFVQVTQTGSTISIAVDTNGATGGHNWSTVADLTNAGTGGVDSVKIIFEGTEHIITI
jgi:VCBS repeat-containing protein